MTDPHPRVVAATQMQLRRRRAALDGGAERVGWKVGANVPEVEELIGSEPVLGHLTTATLLRDGETYDASGDQALRAETEVAIVVGEDDEIAALSVALELVDIGRPPHGMEGIVEANVFHRAFMLGPPRPAAEVGEARLTINGTLRQRAPAAADHAAAVQAIARLLEAAGEGLQPGDRILAGSVNHVPVGPGDHAVVEIDGLGRLEARIA